MAESNDADSIKMHLSVSEVVVVGQRMAVKRENAPQKIEVISSEQLLRSPKKDLTSMLKEYAGLDVVQYPGILSGVSIRGFRPENGKINAKTLILINGRPAGSANLGMIDLANVDRIEILKGPASAIYGPTAMGGVINIITKNSKGDIGGAASFTYGSYNRTGAMVAAGGSILPKLDFDASISNDNNPKDYKLGKGNLFRGWLKSDKAVNYFDKDGSVTEDDDTRGDGELRPFTKYSKTNMDLRLGYDITKDWRVVAYANRSIGSNVESPGDIATGVSPTRKNLAYTSSDVTLEGKLAPNVSLSLKGYYGKDNSENEVIYEKKAFVNPYLSISQNLEWAGAQAQSVIHLGQHSLTVGLDYGTSISNSKRYNSAGEGIKPYNQNFAIDNLGIYAQGSLSFFDNRLNTVLGLRYDYNTFDLRKTELMSNPANTVKNGMVSPSIGVNYKVLPYLFVKANYGSGFSYADIYQLAGYSEVFKASDKTVAITAGNSDLENISSESFDAGLVLKRGGWNGEATYFRTISKNNGIQTFLEVNEDNLKKLGVGYTVSNGDFIYADGSKINGLSTYQNSNHGSIDGLELMLAYDFGYLAAGRYVLNAYASYNTIFTANEEVNDGTRVTKHRMLNVAKNTVIYGVDYSQGRYSAGFKGRFVGFRYDRNWTFFSEYVEVRYPRMMTIDLYAGFTATKKLSFTGYISNLTDENYYEKRGYNLAGRLYSLKATLTF